MVADAGRRTLEVWRDAIPDKRHTFNSVELRFVKAELEPQKTVGLNVVRRSARKVPKAVTKEVREKRAEPEDQTWVISSSMENAILANCCN